LDFEEAAKVRDEIKRLQIVELGIRSGEVEDDSAKVNKDGLE
jgi:excinuclease ABC subunit B